MEAHSQEHSLEVQLPFLQHFLDHEFKIVPILLGGQSVETPKKLARILSPYLGNENLFVISTDLSHYPEYNDAIKIDKNTVEAFCSNDPDLFLEQLKTNELKNYPNLSTSMCGWMAALTLLYMTCHRKSVTYIPLLYQNSGEIPLYGDKSRVVGYQSVAICQKMNSDKDSDAFTKEDKQKLLSIARNSIIGRLKGTTSEGITPDEVPEKYLKPQGAFVSIYVNNDLRGCIGKIESNIPLYETIQQTAISAAFHDTRFPSIKTEEIESMEIEISILTPLKKIESIDDIVPGKHGILIRKDIRSGTFLPQVAARTGWSAQEMLEECSERKAGLGRDGWRDADIYIYEALIISEKEKKDQ
jgi:AmmeMemoRadiSam system protein A